MAVRDQFLGRGTDDTRLPPAPAQERGSAHRQHLERIRPDRPARPDRLLGEQVRRARLFRIPAPRTRAHQHRRDRRPSRRRRHLDLGERADGAKHLRGGGRGTTRAGQGVPAAAAGGRRRSDRPRHRKPPRARPGRRRRQGDGHHRAA